MIGKVIAETNIINLPLLQKGDFYLSESLVILKFICQDNDNN